jgi:hypothetical protein
MHYYKHDHHTGMHPKWRGIAADLGVRPIDVYAIWNLLLEHASRQQDRGSVARFRAGDIAAEFDVPKPQVEAILAEFENRGMIVQNDGDRRLAKWEWYQRDLSTPRVQKHREAAVSVPSAPLRGVPGAHSSTPPANDETVVKRDETRETREREKEIQSLPPVVPPAGRVVELEQERKVQKTDHDGTRADARAGPAIGEAERRKLTKERWQQKMLQEAQRTMPPDRFVTFTVALGDPVPPRWAITELNRLDREVKRRRGSAPQQGSASGGKARGARPGQAEGLLPIVGREAA